MEPPAKKPKQTTFFKRSAVDHHGGDSSEQASSQAESPEPNFTSLPVTMIQVCILNRIFYSIIM